MTADDPDPWARVVGQPEAVRVLQAASADPVHAYLFVGPKGSGKRTAAAVFAGELLAPGSGDDGTADARARDLAAREQHPDLCVVEPEGRALLVDEAARIITEAARAPVEGARKVIVCDRFHTAEPAVAPKLLKSLEEPSPSTVFVLLAEEVPVEHATIASRCVTVDFHPLTDADIRGVLEAEGVDTAAATTAAAASLGDLGRARRLAVDPHAAVRRDLWYSVPSRLDGTGAAVATLVDEIRSRIDEAQDAVEAIHARQREELVAREEAFGTRGSGRREMEARHKRELRLVRDEELRFGFATIAQRYRDAVVEGAGPDPARYAEVLARLSRMGEWLTRNPNEALVLQALLLDLPTVVGGFENVEATSTVVGPPG